MLFFFILNKYCIIYFLIRKFKSKFIIFITFTKKHKLHKYVYIPFKISNDSVTHAKTLFPNIRITPMNYTLTYFPHCKELRTKNHRM